ncbi:MAG TPA: toll/interleukin-1 receptor domain-containing protein [Chthonomonadaceae bacterium]|nr:toll/interleukin-1 receptor domain-containing protein [Chthonomonadaceae bacterium]
MPDPPKLFISYSHDSAEHAANVLALADSLRANGIDVILDQYVNPAPDEGWTHWMERNLDRADFVVMICTSTYLRRVKGEESPGIGHGVRWEGNLIYNRIYGDAPKASRYIPVLLPGSTSADIPLSVQHHRFYVIAKFDFTDPGYEALYRHLTGQHATPAPDIGQQVVLPPRPRPGLNPAAANASMQTAPAPQATGVSALNPLDLIQKLRNLTHSDLSLIVASIPGASTYDLYCNVPERAANLVYWANSVEGPGLQTVYGTAKALFPRVFP